MSRYGPDIRADTDNIGSDIGIHDTRSVSGDPISGNSNIGTHSDISPGVTVVAISEAIL
jgi:hypothetical protein